MSGGGTSSLLLDKATQVVPLPNFSLQSRVAHFAVSSPFVPLHPCSLNEAGEMETQYALPQGAELHTSWTTSTKVPISIAKQTNTTGPVLLQMYDAYGAIVPAKFDPITEVLLHRGWTVATAHLSGGGMRFTK